MQRVNTSVQVFQPFVVVEANLVVAKKEAS